MNLNGRLDRLERMPRHPPRCDACRAWPAWRLIHRHADGREEAPLMPCPAACATCSFRPRPVVVMIPAGV
jgi:hypothetical protein